MTTTTKQDDDKVAATVTAKAEDENDDDEDDEEGLKKHYDVILCGTGLTQSILASALARVGKSVLHVDAADYYGGLEAVWTLPYLLETYCKNKKKSGSKVRKEMEPSSVASASSSDTNILSLHEEGAGHSLEILSVERKTWPVSKNSLVVTPYGKGKVVSLLPYPNDKLDSTTNTRSFYRLSIQLTAWTLADGTSPMVHVGIPSQNVQQQLEQQDATATIDPDFLWNHHKIQTIQAAVAARVLDQQSRSLALDITPYLLYANGPAVTGLIDSSVSEYLEFKTLEGLLYMNHNTTTNQQKQKQSDDDCVLSLSRVPCSKNDVFASKLLSPMDKRRLMKFLQTAMDYATAEALKQEEAAAVAKEHQQQKQFDDNDNENEASSVDEGGLLKSWNERHLNQGRSLQRPQNKAVASTDLEQLQQLCENGNASQFETYLTETQRLSKSLTALVRYALALETGDDNNNDNTSTSTASGMKQLCAHMLALGRFGGTAFLVPLYGSGELAQAFCRSAAVYGATYLLRRAPTGIVVVKDDNSNNNNNKVQGVLLNGPRHQQQHEQQKEDEKSAVASKQIACSHVVVPDGALVSSSSLSTRKSSNERRQRVVVLRRISILCGKPLMTDSFQQQQQRHVVILPPHTLGSNQRSTIHGLLLDEAVNVAPHVPGGCTVLHLTTTVTVDAATGQVDDNVLEQALNAILKSCRKNGTKSDNNAASSAVVDELFHVSFCYDLLTTTRQKDGETADCDGMHVIDRPRPGLTADACFEQAAQIFSDICPGQDFLKMSKEMDETVKERLGDSVLDDEDDVKAVLDSAVGMIGGSEKTAAASDNNASDD